MPLMLVLGCQSEVQAPALPPPTVTVANPLAKAVTDWDEYTGRLEAVQAVEVRARVRAYPNNPACPYVMYANVR
jgi:membrane fusion protein, multidrug efflux system